MKSLLSKLLIAGLALNLTFAPTTGLAANIIFDAHGDIVSDADGVNPNLPVAGDQGTPNTPSTETNRKPQSAEERLRQERREDERRCQEEMGLGNSFQNLAEQSGTVANTVAQGLQQQLPQTINSFVSEQLPVLLQEKLKVALPALIQEGLGGRLPGFVNNAISNMLEAGFSQGDISSQMSSIFSQGVNQIVPQLLRDELPLMAEDIIRDEMPGYMGSRLSGSLPGIIQNSDIPQRVTELVAEAVAQANRAQQSGYDEAENWADYFNSNTRGVGVAGTMDPQSIRVTANQQAVIQQGVLQGMSRYAGEGVASSNALNDIVEALLPFLIDSIGEQLAPQLSSVLNSGFTEAGGLDHFYQQGLSLGGVDFTGAGYDLSQGLSGEILNPMVNSMLPTVSQLGYNLPGDVWSAFNSNSVFSVNDIVGGQTAADAVAAGVDPTNPAAIEAWDGSMAEINEANSNLAADGIGNISANSGDIGQGALSSQALSGLGDSLKGGLAGSVGGMVGNLVGEIPIAGGLLAPIAQTYVTQAMLAMMGLPADFLGFPVADVGLGFNVSQGFKGLGKITGEVVKNTGQTTQELKNLNDTQKKAKELLMQACINTRVTRRINERLEEKEFVYDRDSSKASFMALRQIFNELRDYFAKSYKTSPGLSGTDNTTGAGQDRAASVVADRRQDPLDAGTEARAGARDDIRRSGGIYAEEAADSLERAENYDPLASTMTQEEIDSLNNPESLDADTLRARRLAYLNPFGNNNPDSAFLTYRQYEQQAEAEAEAVARDEYLAGQGYRPGRECLRWVESSSGKICARWQVITPGATNKTVSDASFTSLLDRINTVDEEGEDAIINLLSKLFLSFKNPGANSQQAGSDSPVGSDTCPGPEPCQNSGWQPRQISSGTSRQLSNNDLSELFDLFTGLIENFNSGSSDFQLPETDTSSTIDFSIDSFSYSPETSMISWEAWSAYNCMAANDWLGTEIKAGEDLIPWGGAVGQATTTLPAIHNNLEYSLTCSGGYPAIAKTTSFTIPSTNTNP